jgi:hypothetical protein
MSGALQLPARDGRCCARVRDDLQLFINALARYDGYGVPTPPSRTCRTRCRSPVRRGVQLAVGHRGDRQPTLPSIRPLIADTLSYAYAVVERRRTTQRFVVPTARPTSCSSAYAPVPQVDLPD